MKLVCRWIAEDVFDMVKGFVAVIAALRSEASLAAYTSSHIDLNSLDDMGSPRSATHAEHFRESHSSIQGIKQLHDSHIDWPSSNKCVSYCLIATLPP